MAHESTALWSRLSPQWQACLELAWEAYVEGHIPVGAIVTDARGEIRARGHARGQANGLAHAEIAALTSLSAEREGLTLWSSLEPCPLCLGGLYMSGVRELRFAARDPWAGSVNLLGTTEYLSRKPIRVTPPEDRLLEGVCTLLHMEAQLQRKGRPDDPVIATTAKVFPEAVAMAERVFADDLLQQMRRQGDGADRVVNAVADRLCSGI